MKYSIYAQYNPKWVNVCLKRRLTNEQIEWLYEHDGGQFHIHNMQQAVKFEREQDAEWFVMKWV